MSCSLSGLLSLRHNEIHDITASLLSEVAHDVAIEPELQLLSGEDFPLRSANTEDHARLNVAARGLWGSRFERKMIDVCVFNPFLSSNRNLTLPSAYGKHEQEKRRSCEQRVLEVEHSSFVPVVFSTTGSQGKTAAAFYPMIAGNLSEKRCEPFSVTMAYVRTRLSFGLIRSAIASLRGNRCRPSQHGSASAIPAAAECSFV